jgi:hypothetical protein
VKFFLVSIAETSKKGITTFEQILKLKENIEGKRIVKLGKKLPKAKQFMDVLYKSPVVSVAHVETELDVSKPTANSLVNDFVSRTSSKKRRADYGTGCLLFESTSIYSMGSRR